MRLLLFLLLALAIPAPLPSQTPAETFEASRYDSPRWKVTEQTYPFGDLSIRIVHVKAMSEEWGDLPDDQRFLCKGFLEVWKGNRVVERLYGAEIEPLGDSGGLFVPESQPIKNHFLVAKLGDYDGRLFVISREGKAVDVPGGAYFVDRSRQILISEHRADVEEPALVALDLRTGRALFKVPEIPQKIEYNFDPQIYEDCTSPTTPLKRR